MEIIARKLSDPDLDEIAHCEFDVNGVHKLLCHIKWQEEERERIKEEFDTYRDAAYSGAFASQAKRAQNEAEQARDTLLAIRVTLGLPYDTNHGDLIMALQQVAMKLVNKNRAMNGALNYLESVKVRVAEVERCLLAGLEK